MGYKSVHIAKSRKWYDKTLSKFLLHVLNHALKDMYMLNYGSRKNKNNLCCNSIEVLIDFIDSLITVQVFFTSNSIFQSRFKSVVWFTYFLCVFQEVNF